MSQYLDSPKNAQAQEAHLPLMKAGKSHVVRSWKALPAFLLLVLGALVLLAACGPGPTPTPTDTPIPPTPTDTPMSSCSYQNKYAFQDYIDLVRSDGDVVHIKVDVVTVSGGMGGAVEISENGVYKNSYDTPLSWASNQIYIEGPDQLVDGKIAYVVYTCTNWMEKSRM
jgi:hypothetical protein